MGIRFYSKQRAERNFRMPLVNHSLALFANISDMVSDRPEHRLPLFLGVLVGKWLLSDWIMERKVKSLHK